MECNKIQVSGVDLMEHRVVIYDRTQVVGCNRAPLQMPQLWLKLEGRSGGEAPVGSPHAQVLSPFPAQSKFGLRT